MEQPRRDRIIQAALEVFAEKGFAGTSMSAVAKGAKVPQSLIYHYFENKLALWHQVKEDFVVQRYKGDSFDDLQELTLEGFIERYAKARFMFYLENPVVLRMMNWQRLEQNQAELEGKTIVTQPVARVLALLQDNHQVRKDVTPEMLALWLGGMITAPLFDHYVVFKNNPAICEDYLRLLKDILLKTLQPQFNRKMKKL
jgi:AcrR family transcriptional regulator